MKIQYLKLFNERYRGLETFERDFPKHILLRKHIDPICLVGLNGSGKSNFLELIADIFYDLEIFFLFESENKLYDEDSPKYFAYANNDREPIYFDLKYKINIKEENQPIQAKEIRITRRPPTGRSKKKPEPVFRVKAKELNLHNIAEDGYESIATSEARKYLPLVIGYTSGLNDLLSMPFIDLQDFYAQQVAKEATTPKQSKRGKSAKSNQKIQSPNLLMLNYDSNSAIVISNLLLGEPEKIKILQETTKIERLDSFRIVIRWNKLYTKRKLEVTNELQRYIDDLIECAALKDIKKEPGEGEIYTLDFKYSDAVRELFRKKFNNSLNLFEALTKLNLLNTLCIQRAQREKLRKRREKGQLLKFPQVASLDKIFGIEDVKLILKLTDKHYVLTEYEKISDGEHQFMHIAGGILLFDQKVYNRDIVYLLDEFDTHFNPIWRSDFFYKLESLLKNKDVEFLITTHSPFILSDCHGYNVLKFTREGDKITFERVTNETYGSTFENILESVFRSNLKADEHFNNQMAKLSFNQIQSIYGKLQTVNSKDELQELFKEIKLLGESIDRLQILKEYAEIEKRFVN